MTGGAGGSGGTDFVPASDVQMDELRRKSRVWRHVTQGQRLGTWEKRHGDYKLHCNYCKHVLQGNLFKAQRHFTQLKRCAAATIDVFVDIWNHTDYEFDKRHHRSIVAYMREHDIADRRAVDVQRGSGRGRTGASQSQPEERDPVDDVQEFLDEEARRAEAREGGGTGATPDLAGEKVVMTARGSSAAVHHKGDAPGAVGKRPVGSRVEGVPQVRKRQRQSTLDEVYDPDGQAAFRDTFLQWAYDSGIPFAALRRRSWYRHKKALTAMSRGVRPIRTMHMLEPAHAAAHLLNPRRRSLRYYESARRTAADLEVITECDSFFLAQTGGNAAGDAYLRVREQMRSFHSKVGHTTDRVTRDAKAEACAGIEETSRCASWWVEHGACFPDLQEIAGRVMHMWTSASPAERNWAEHERIHTAKRNKLKFKKVAQLVEIATNLKLLGCSDHSGGYVLPWGHMATLAEARSDEYIDVPIDDRDEEEEPEPEVWGARPQSAVAAHEVSAQVCRFQQQGFRRPKGVGEVFGPRAETLHPYNYVPPPPAEPAQTLEQESDSEDLLAGVDKSAERLYYTYGAGPDGFQPHCTVIQESDDGFHTWLAPLHSHLLHRPCPTALRHQSQVELPGEATCRRRRHLAPTHSSYFTIRGAQCDELTRA
ncbi:hypothetical protein CBR_g29869 [Chara braunii]|uniref:BED-type domain-containing protein n=1 Tax=Chara braunii TaxID=69332 RepID=A0A388JWS7_CHABU|nr:hypothetical protein CBR_g29869 [Chara braunii]|eukprot:GBG62261.1 hypothetical protein CBR_g29869 [Chara braunii]